jgi:hypothetical protein
MSPERLHPLMPRNGEEERRASEGQAMLADEGDRERKCALGFSFFIIYSRLVVS